LFLINHINAIILSQSLKLYFQTKLKNVRIQIVVERKWHCLFYVKRGWKPTSTWTHTHTHTQKPHITFALLKLSMIEIFDCYIPPPFLSEIPDPDRSENHSIMPEQCSGLKYNVIRPKKDMRIYCHPTDPIFFSTPTLTLFIGTFIISWNFFFLWKKMGYHHH
jgi:hypothetical protein